MAPSARFSRGCFACRAKKVKCDETRPACLRCLKAGRSCPGYRSHAELVFRDMNRVAEKQVKSRVSIKSADASNTQSSLVTVSFGSDTTATSSHDYLHGHRQLANKPLLHMMVPSMGSRWQETAIDRLFADYVPQPDPMGWQFLPKICRDAPSLKHLKEALYATAFVNQANQLGLEWLGFEATKCYGRLLRLMPKVLQNPVDAKKQSTLGTVFLVSLYEMISGYKPTGALWEAHHHEGRVSLLRLYSKKQFTSPIWKGLARITYNQIMQKCLNRHFMPPEEAETWCDLIYGIEGLSPQLAKINICVTRLCAEAQALFDSPVHGEAWTNALLAVAMKALLIDLEYRNWNEIALVSNFWEYRKLTTLSDVQRSADAPQISMGAGAMVDQPLVYHNIWIAFAWNNYRGCRIHLHEVLLHCTSLLRPVYGSQPASLDLDVIDAQSHALIPDLISDICASSPFCLGDIDLTGKPVVTDARMPLAGYMLLFPLHSARASVQEGSERDMWLRGRLEYIATKMGICQGKLLADRVRKEPWDLS